MLFKFLIEILANQHNVCCTSSCIIAFGMPNTCYCQCSSYGLVQNLLFYSSLSAVKPREYYFLCVRRDCCQLQQIVFILIVVGEIEMLKVNSFYILYFKYMCSKEFSCDVVNR